MCCSLHSVCHSTQLLIPLLVLWPAPLCPHNDASCMYVRNSIQLEGCTCVDTVPMRCSSNVFHPRIRRWYLAQFGSAKNARKKTHRAAHQPRNPLLVPRHRLSPWKLCILVLLVPSRRLYVTSWRAGTFPLGRVLPWCINFCPFLSCRWRERLSRH